MIQKMWSLRWFGGRQRLPSPAVSQRCGVRNTLPGVRTNLYIALPYGPRRQKAAASTAVPYMALLCSVALIGHQYQSYPALTTSYSSLWNDIVAS